MSSHGSCVPSSRTTHPRLRAHSPSPTLAPCQIRKSDACVKLPPSSVFVWSIRSPFRRCRHKLASMPRWLSSQKVEVVRKLLAGEPTFVCKCPFYILSALFVRVRRGSGYAVRTTPSHALGHSSCGTLATSSGSSVVSFSLLAVKSMGRMLGFDQQRRTSSGSLWSVASLCLE